MLLPKLVLLAAPPAASSPPRSPHALLPGPSQAAGWATRTARHGPARPAAPCARGPRQGALRAACAVRGICLRAVSGPCTIVTPTVWPLMLPLGLMDLPRRAVRARRWPKQPRSTSPRSWRGSCRRAAAPVPALASHLCKPLQTGAFAPTDACIRAALWLTSSLTELKRRRWSAWPCAPLACRPRCPR